MYSLHIKETDLKKYEKENAQWAPHWLWQKTKKREGGFLKVIHRRSFCRLVLSFKFRLMLWRVGDVECYYCVTCSSWGARRTVAALSVAVLVGETFVGRRHIGKCVTSDHQLSMFEVAVWQTVCPLRQLIASKKWPWRSNCNDRDLGTRWKELVGSPPSMNRAIRATDRFLQLPSPCAKDLF